MAESSPNPTLAQIDHAHGDDHAGHVRTYWRVFFSLAIFTAIEYFYARIYKDAFIVLVLGLLTWATIKATLVGLYFMHLKYEGKWVLGMLVPAGILAVVLVCALIPDVAMQPITEINNMDEDSATEAAAEPSPSMPAAHPPTGGTPAKPAAPH
jgi:cytochrome c oxidase subunit 4